MKQDDLTKEKFQQLNSYQEALKREVNAFIT